MEERNNPARNERVSQTLENNSLSFRSLGLMKVEMLPESIKRTRGRLACLCQDSLGNLKWWTKNGKGLRCNVKTASHLPDPERKSYQRRRNKALSLTTNPPVRRRSLAMAAVGTGLAGPGWLFMPCGLLVITRASRWRTFNPGVPIAYQEPTDLLSCKHRLVDLQAPFSHHRSPCSMRTEHAVAPSRVGRPSPWKAPT